MNLKIGGSDVSKLYFGNKEFNGDIESGTIVVYWLKSMTFISTYHKRAFIYFVLEVVN